MPRRNRKGQYRRTGRPLVARNEPEPTPEDLARDLVARGRRGRNILEATHQPQTDRDPRRG